MALPAVLAGRPLLASFLSGALATAALPPLHLAPALLAFALWLALLHSAPGVRARAARGFAFGLGWHLAGLYWIGIAFFTDAERFGALAVPAVVGLAALNALFPMAAALLAGARRWRSPIAAALALALAWSLADGLRDELLLGFTWNPLATVWAPWPALLQPAAWLGSDGLSLATATIAILPGAALLAREAPPRRGPLLAAVLLALLAAAGAARLALVAPEPEPGTRVRIVQGNIAQHHKWDPDKRLLWFQRHLELSARASAAPLDLVVWPESAVPFSIERDPVVRELLGEAAPPGGFIVTGGDRVELDATPPVASNSVFVLDHEGRILARYDKVDLVPFGEYLPWRSVLSRIGLEKLTQGSFDFRPGPGRRTLRIDGLPPFSPLVCYEAIFPGRAIDPADRPAFLVNLTNDAWFGTSSGPYQHAAMAILRAIEEGLPLLRAANTGISLATDAMGRIVARLGLNETGVLDVALPGPLSTPPLFRRSAGWSSVFLFIVVFFTVVWQEARRGSAARNAE
ncbi:MAG: apolipoprotein N-acyltransferase [Geminicoccaceae bacterium]|nr:apolipoprotein N-acyltransferase [Geminicoccaceae bacterium]